MTGRVEGIILDQDGMPISGAEIRYEENEHRAWLPILWIPPAYQVSREGKVSSDSEGKFLFDQKYKILNFKSISKKGYFSESLRPAHVLNDKTGKSEQYFWLYQILSNQVSSVRSGHVEWTELPQNGEEVWITLGNDSISNAQAHSGDIAVALHQRLEETNFWPFVIRAANGGVFFCANDLPYAPKGDYERGFVADARKIGGGVWPRNKFPFFAKVRHGSRFARAWLELDLKRRLFRVAYWYNESGGRFLYRDGQSSYSPTLQEFGDIQHISPAESEWWRRFDLSSGFAIIQTETLLSAWGRYKNATKSPVIDRARSSSAGEQSFQYVLISNPFTPRELLQEPEVAALAQYWKYDKPEWREFLSRLEPLSQSANP